MFRESHKYHCSECRIDGAADIGSGNLWDLRLAVVKDHRKISPECPVDAIGSEVYVVDTEGLKKQEYFCQHCGINGSVLIEEHADVSTVVNVLDLDHKQHAPHCHTSASALRVRTEASEEKDRGAIITSQYLTFVKIEQKPRTSVWRVDDRDGNELGRVFFYSKWRQYSYEATSPAIYSSGCLADIMRFIASLERTRRSGIQAADSKLQQEKTW